MRLRLCWQQISILAPMWFQWSRRPLVWMGSSSTTPSSQLCSHMIYTSGGNNKHHGRSCSTATLWWPRPFMMAWSACTHQATFMEIWKTTTFSSKSLMQMVARAVSCWVISALPERSGVRSLNFTHRITLVPAIWLPASLMAKVTLSASTPWFGFKEPTSTQPLCRPKLTTALGPWWSHTSSAFPRTRISRRCLGRVVVDPWALEDASSTPERQTAGPEPQKKRGGLLSGRCGRFGCGKLSVAWSIMEVHPHWKRSVLVKHLMRWFLRRSLFQVQNLYAVLDISWYDTYIILYTICT